MALRYVEVSLSMRGLETRAKGCLPSLGKARRKVSEYVDRVARTIKK